MNPMQMDLSTIAPRLKKRSPDSSKRDFGTLTIIAGSANYRGAASLACLSAFRAGCGIVRLASIEQVIAAVACGQPEVIFLPLPGSMTASQAGLPVILDAAANSTAVLAGCGMTAVNDTGEIVLSLIRECGNPLILDADAINVLAGRANILASSKTTPVLTPHWAEMSRLTESEFPAIERNPAKAAGDFAGEYGCVLVLKGPETYIAFPCGDVFVCGKKNSGLAKGGSGDVLAGLIASLIAQGHSPEDASLIGVWIHSEAADICRNIIGERTMLPSDLAEFYKIVFRDLDESLR